MAMYGLIKTITAISKSLESKGRSSNQSEELGGALLRHREKNRDPKELGTRSKITGCRDIHEDTSANTEGFGNEGGRGASTWDSMIQDGIGDTDIAVDSYHRYKDPPSYESPLILLAYQDDFKAYADICYKKFGDRVKHWVTINEPQIFGQFGYSIGLNYPDANPVTDPFLATHNIILAHSAAAKLYKDTYQATQQGEVGISLVTQWFEPYDNTRQNKDAAKRALEFLFGWILEPMVYGDYPFIMKALVRDALPTFTEEEKSLVKGSLDFIGVNYYTSRYATALPLDANQSYTSQDQYQRVDLTGYPERRDDTIPVEIALEDDARIRNILRHLYAISQAIKGKGHTFQIQIDTLNRALTLDVWMICRLGVNVKGYFMWSLMDCLEVGSGYQVRFGFNYTDYLNNLNRTPKKSARWLRSFAGLGQSQ
ncbi:hypothetical protein LguiA_016971 [Lonicera macranthoides]